MIPKNMLDVPKIREMIRSKHKAFMDEVGHIPIKISADRQLALTRLSARISQVLACIKEEGVIDRVEPCAMPESFYSHKGFHVTKAGFEKSIFIWTDGSDIVVTDASFLINAGFRAPFYQVFRDVDVDVYDWEEFTELLLGYIHMIVYERQMAYEKAIWKDQDAGK